ncbi:hypothetical protein [Sphingomonas melonis]|uniref:hypothetical protein n=1 Tax=Sphingomonas melonis TaxID=152682 RepID=UPI0015C72F8F|nr:hypothetical protein [Sphingomonas melonis]
MAALAALFVATPAAAQVVSPLNIGGSSVDTSGLATKTDLTAAQQTAAQAKAAADAAALAAANACQPDPSVPPMETVGGAAGSGMACRLANAVQPRISRTVTGTTVTGGTGTVSWPAMPSVPKLTVTPYVASSAAQAPMCFPVTGSVTTTGATIKCFTSQSVTVSLLGAVVAPITTAAAGVTFDVLALPQS